MNSYGFMVSYIFKWFNFRKYLYKYEIIVNNKIKKYLQNIVNSHSLSIIDFKIIIFVSSDDIDRYR